MVFLMDFLSSANVAVMPELLISDRWSSIRLYHCASALRYVASYRCI